ncbi:MAG: phosphatidate cytidylyltransferase [Chloroflexota bacterium]|nr:phosphatidate cytidylyltransferase [Chloroflexota bacterium]
MSGLERRIGTALVYGVIVLAAIFAPPPTFIALVAILAALGYVELRALFRYRPYQPWLIGIVFTVLFVIAHMVQTVWTDGLLPMTIALCAAFGVVAILVFVAEAARHRPSPAVAGAVFTLGGALYLGLLFGYLVDLSMADGAATKGYLGRFPVWLALAFVPTWAADITAYFVGSSIGRRLIAPQISPKKTWEGTLAGFAAAAVVALLIATSAGIKTGPTLFVAALVGPVGFASDLFESAIKRAAGAKDSGTLLPGHGGVLDRIDSLIFVAPLVALALAIAVMVG